MVLHLMAASPQCPKREVCLAVFSEQRRAAMQRAALNSLLPSVQFVSTSPPSRCSLPGYHLLNLCFFCFA